MRCPAALLTVLIAAQACWADFPDSRLGQADSAARDTGRPPDGLPPADAGRGPDTRRADHTARDSAITCVPDGFLECRSTRVLVRCLPTGKGTVEVDCGAFVCDGVLRRCNGCDPASPPSCKGTNLSTCTVDGLPQIVGCGAGCQDGACCTDADHDGSTTCAGDCNDGDVRVHPGQTGYFPSPSGGSFDFNCDGEAEPRYPDLVDCAGGSGGCAGSGWSGQVPACGAQGMYATCKKQGQNCVPEGAPRAQSCR
jgi:hypothetical protein